jgi:hypothetical protein
VRRGAAWPLAERPSSCLAVQPAVSRADRWPHRRAPSWLPSARACRLQQHGSRSSGVVVPRCPDVHRALLALPCPLSASPCPVSGRPVSGTRCMCPASARPVSACPVSGIRYPVSACGVRVSGVRCERPASVRLASVSALSAPVSWWSAWMRWAAHTPRDRPGRELLDPWKLVSRLISQSKTFTIRNEKHRPLCQTVSATGYEPLGTSLPAVIPLYRFLFEPPNTKRFSIPP